MKFPKWMPLVLLVFVAVSARGADLTNAVPEPSTNSTRTPAPGTGNAIQRETVQEAEKLLGLEFSDAKIDQILAALRSQLRNYQNLRKVALSNSVPPAVQFNPIPVGTKFDTAHKDFTVSLPENIKLPANRDEIAFFSIKELAALIKSKQITSEQLTRFYLDRLKKYGPKLNCTVTLTEDLALEQARRADQEIAAGKYRGPLHGVPFGAKDLFSAKGIRTTWGSAPYTNQVFEYDATVIKRLEDAGAVLIAKLTLGELAMGDIWFGGQTHNPWNLSQGSSGSSAGSAAATSAGLVGFAIGTETRGSIVSPCSTCGVVGLRPTYGRVSRVGAMALSWSMDKVGPICRSAEDCAIVFNAICGPDGVDQMLYDVPFNYPPEKDFERLRIGYLKVDFERGPGNTTNNQATLEKFRELGAKLIPIELPTNYPVNDLEFILFAEAAASFDELTRSGQDDWMARQRGWWPSYFRQARFIPAVEYIEANRIRWLIVQDMARLFKDVDLFLAPTAGGTSSLLTNLTGHPCVVLPNGFNRQNMPTGICFIGNLFGESELLAVAKKYEDATEFHTKHPTMPSTE